MARLIFVLLSFVTVFIAEAKGMFKMDKFEWFPTESAHKSYPMTLTSGDLILKDGSHLYVPSRAIMDNGWGKVGSTHVVGQRYKHLPQVFTATWFSYAENKFFAGEFKLPYEKILSLFQTGTHHPVNGEAITYNNIIFGIGPEGAVSVWLKGGGQVVEVATYTGVEVAGDWKSVLDNENLDRLEFIEDVLKESLSPQQLHDLKEHGVPRGISDLYRSKYTWSLSLAGPKDGRVWISALNGETELVESVKNNSAGTPRGIPKLIQVDWKSDTGIGYTADVKFDETEVVAAFKKVSAGGPGQPLQLQLEFEDNPRAIQPFLRNSTQILKLNRCTVKAYRQQ